MKTSLDPSSSTSTFSFSVAAFGLLPSPHAFCETTLHTSFHLWNLHLKPILPNESFVPWVVQKLEVGRNWGQWRPPPHVNLLLPGLSNVAHYWLHQSWRTFTWLPFLIPLFQSCLPPEDILNFLENKKIVNENGTSGAWIKIPRPLFNTN